MTLGLFSCVDRETFNRNKQQTQEAFSRFQWKLDNTTVLAEGFCIYHEASNGHQILKIIDPISQQFAIIYFHDDQPRSVVIGPQAALIFGEGDIDDNFELTRVSETVYGTHGRIEVQTGPEGILTGQWEANIAPVLSEEAACQEQLVAACGYKSGCNIFSDRCTNYCGGPLGTGQVCPNEFFDCIDSQCIPNSTFSGESIGFFQCTTNSSQESTLLYQSIEQPGVIQLGQCTYSTSEQTLAGTVDTGQHIVLELSDPQPSKGAIYELGQDVGLRVLSPKNDDLFHATDGKLYISDKTAHSVSGFWLADNLEPIPALGETCSPEILTGCALGATCNLSGATSKCLLKCDAATSCPPNSNCESGLCRPAVSTTGCEVATECLDHELCNEDVSRCEPIPVVDENELIAAFACEPSPPSLNTPWGGFSIYSWRHDETINASQTQCVYTALSPPNERGIQTFEFFLWNQQADNLVIGVQIIIQEANIEAALEIGQITPDATEVFFVGTEDINIDAEFNDELFVGELSSPLIPFRESNRMSSLQPNIMSTQLRYVPQVVPTTTADRVQQKSAELSQRILLTYLKSANARALSP